MFSIVTLPSPTNFLTDIGAWSTEMFSQWQNVAFLVIGLMIGGMLITFLFSAVSHALNSLIGENKALSAFNRKFPKEEQTEENWKKWRHER